MKSKLLFLSLLAAATISNIHADNLLTWTTFGETGTETSVASASNLTGVEAASLVLGSGVNPANNGNRLGGNQWFDTGDTSPTTLASAIVANEYIEFTLTPSAGFSVSVTSFSFIWDGSPTGPSSLTLRSSFDSYAGDLGTATGQNVTKTSTTLNPVTSGNFTTISISGLTNLTSAVTFRLYGYGATGTTGSGGFDTNANTAPNVVLIGSVTPTTAVPEPHEVSIAIAGLLGVVILIRRKASRMA